MLDWDADYDSFVASTDTPAEPVVKAPRGRPAALGALLRSGVRRLVLPALIGLLLGLGGTGAVGHDRVRVQVAALVSMQGGWFTAEEVMPAALRVYDQSQFDHFRRGMARFSDADLLVYVRTTERGLGPLDDPMTAYALDALYLAQREVDRRGLHRPLASLRSAFGRS